MDEFARLLTLLALVGGALTLLGAVFVWRLDEVRRIRRSLSLVLEADPEPLLTARGRGRAIGFNLVTRRLAVTSDRGDWCLVYGIDEMMGVELIVDRQVVARAFRSESRRPLDQLDLPEAWVRLRFVFDDPGHSDFEIDLWRPDDDDHSNRLDAESALREANRWMARTEALLRRWPTGAPQRAPGLPIRRQIQSIQLVPPLIDDEQDEDRDEPWDSASVDDEASERLHRKM